MNSKSNHLPAILKQIPKMIEHRSSKHSSSNNLLSVVKKDYENALKLNGYTYWLKYMDQKINRNRKCIWFSLSFCKPVSTNLGKKCLGIINKHVKKSKLSKLINKNNIKLSCMQNI